MWEMMHHGLPLGLPLMLLSWIFWLVLLGALVALLVRWLSSRQRAGIFYPPPMSAHQPPMPPHQPSALEILRRRYAAGEIDAATFEQMRERLDASRGPGSE